MEIVQNNNNGENTSNNVFDNTKFPEGMRVLAVDDNSVCLKLLTSLLNKCRYQVTSLSNKSEALQLLKQNAKNFDLVLTNVYINEMEGFKLLEAGRELNIPVIMVSASESTDIILKGIRYGAVHYLIKPIRLEVVKTIWQHVIRKKHACSRSKTPLVNDEDTTQAINNDDHNTEEVRDDENGKSVENDGTDEIQSDQETSKDSRKSCKKERMKWTEELKAKFISIVELLGGIDKAQPKKILELLIVDYPDITREQIASHLQKVRKSRKEKQNNEQSLNNHNNQNDDDLQQYKNAIDFSLMSASSSHQPLLGNPVLSRGESFWLNYQHQPNYTNPWQVTPSTIGYNNNTPVFQDPKMMSNTGNNIMVPSFRKPIELIPQHPKMMSNSGNNIMVPSFSKPTELIPQHPKMMSNSENNIMVPSSSKPNELILQQPKMMSNELIMGSSSKCMTEELNNPFDTRMQLPEVVFDQGPSTMDSSSEFLQWVNIFNGLPSEYPSFDFSEDDNKDLRNC